MSKVLVRLPGGAGVVRHDDGEIVITHDVADGTGQRVREDDRYRPVKAWLDGDRCVVGGLLPPGALGAELIDDRGTRVRAQVGGGAYVAALAQPMDGRDAIVCCRGADGTVIRRPPPAPYPCTAVPDAEEPCPACGAITFEECTPTESWRGGTPGPGGTVIPNPIVVCRVCGHAETSGTFFAIAMPDDGSQDAAAREERIARVRAHARAQRWYSDLMTLRAATFPIYAAERWPAAIGGSASSNDVLTDLTIAHFDTPNADPYAGDQPRLEVTTSNDDRPGTELAVARDALYSWLQSEGETWPDASEAARTLWLAARERTLRASVLHAIASEQTITIDGSPQPFLTLSSPHGRWVAVRCHHDLMVTVAGHDIAAGTLTLEPIGDPAGRLLGPEPDDPEA